MSVLRLLLFSSLCSFIAEATELDRSEESKHSFNAFVSQGTTWTSENSYVEDNGGWTAEQTYIGGNASYRFDDNWRVAAQGIYINGGNRMLEGTRIDYAFLEYTFMESLDNQYRLYIGRYKHKMGLYRTVRDIPNVQPSAYLPQSVYQDMYRDMTLNTDGLSLDGFNSYTDYDIEWQLNAGRTDYDDDIPELVIGEGATGKYREDYVLQYALYVHWDNWTLGSSGLYAETDYYVGDNEPIPFLVDAHAILQQYVWTAQYLNKHHELVFEYSDLHSDIDGIFPGLSESTRGGGGYLQYRHFFTEQWEMFVRHDRFVFNNDDKRGNDFERQTGLPGYLRYQNTTSIGAGYSPSNNTMIRAEYHYIEGAATIPGFIFQDPIANPDKYWDMFTVQFSYWW